MFNQGYSSSYGVPHRHFIFWVWVTVDGSGVQEQEGAVEVAEGEVGGLWGEGSEGVGPEGKDGEVTTRSIYFEDS